MKKTSQTSQTVATFKKQKLALAIAAQLWTCASWAGPQGGEIIGGRGAIEKVDTTTTIIQETDRLAIDLRTLA